MIHDGVSYFNVDDTLEPCELATGVEVTNPERYEPIILIRGGGDVQPDLVDRAAERASVARSTVRSVINALIQEARG